MIINTNGQISPTAFDSPRSFPYTLLEDRRFEELLYSVFKARIAREPGFREQFDHVLLMPGVAEQGQDSILSKKGQRTGTIQCKQEASLLTKPDCLREIIKFVLHAILDPELLLDPKSFTYFLAASKGFNGEATKLIATFNRKAADEPELREWTEQVISRNKRLQSLTYSAIAVELKAVLQQIRVEPIIPTDLDGWLYQYPEVALAFFQIKVLEMGTREVVPATSFTSSLPDHVIQTRFLSASAELRHCPASFGSLPNTHIPRQETNTLQEWILTPLRHVNGNAVSDLPTVAVLSGNAGYGKTTILRDLLLRLQELAIPVLGIKTDQLAITRRTQLAEELHLGEDLEKLVYTLSQQHERVVVLLDQLDALSQSLSADRQALRIYNRLVDQLAVLPNVRIVVSCRRYDLQYDPALVQYQKKYVVEVTPLTREAVEKVFGRLGLGPQKLSDRLYNLLKVPLHLHVFCSVCGQVADFSALRNLQDLYHVLWRQKLLEVPAGSPSNSIKLVELVQRVALTMYEKQQISISYRLYETAHKAELDYLRSHFLLHVEADKVQFFHQSFFDYVFARTFVEKEYSISADVAGTPMQPKHQGLFIRSQVRQVIAYLREVDPDAYIREVRTLLGEPVYRFHIKLLTLQFLAFQSDPSPQEQRLVHNIVFSNSVLREAFIESVSAPTWFGWLMRTNLLQPLLALDYETQRGRLYQLCRRVQEQDAAVVLQWLLRLSGFSQRNDFIGSVLFVRSDFTDPGVLGLVEAIEQEGVNDEWYFHVLENAANDQPEWVALKILERVRRAPIQPAGHKAKYLPVDDYSFSRAMEKLFKSSPETAICTGLTLIESIISSSKSPYYIGPPRTLFGDAAFSFYSPQKDRSLHPHYHLEGLLRKWLVEAGIKDSESGSRYLTRLFNSNSATLLSLGLYLVIQLPATYAGLFYERSMTNSFWEEFDYAGNEYFQYSVLEALKACFPFFTTAQQEIVAERILSLNPSYEYWLFKQSRGGSYSPIGYAKSLVSKIGKQVTI